MHTCFHCIQDAYWSHFGNISILSWGVVKRIWLLRNSPTAMTILVSHLECIWDSIKMHLEHDLDTSQMIKLYTYIHKWSQFMCELCTYTSHDGKRMWAVHVNRLRPRLQATTTLNKGFLSLYQNHWVPSNSEAPLY